MSVINKKSSEIPKIRGFEQVSEAHRTAFDLFTDEKKQIHKFPKAITLPTRSDPRSSGYDFYLPKDLKLLPMQAIIVWTDVKAYMLPDEELLLFIRSSLASKNGLMLRNCVGKVDSSYYENPSNDGNIGINLINTTGITVDLKAGDRIAQGTFYKYLTTDNDETAAEIRTGGFGSSGI